MIVRHKNRQISSEESNLNLILLVSVLAAAGIFAWLVR
jgi:hypothetical protein